MGLASLLRHAKNGQQVEHDFSDCPLEPNPPWVLHSFDCTMQRYSWDGELPIVDIAYVNEAANARLYKKIHGDKARAWLMAFAEKRT